MTRSDDICKSMVLIQIDTEKQATLSGFISRCDGGYAYVIADATKFKGRLGVKTMVYFPGGEVSEAEADSMVLTSGIVGLQCKVHDTNLLKVIKICDRPLEMCETVYVYEGINKRLTQGNVTRFHGEHFDHSSDVATWAELGAPVINKDGELVGMNRSVSYHLRAICISALAETIMKI